MYIYIYIILYIQLYIYKYTYHIISYSIPMFAGKNDSTSPMARPSLPRLATSRLLGGEAALWTERMDFTNVLCRAWPRGFAVAAPWP